MCFQKHYNVNPTLHCNDNDVVDFDSFRQFSETVFFKATGNYRKLPNNNDAPENQRSNFVVSS